MNEAKLPASEAVISRLYVCARAGCGEEVATWHRHERGILIAQHGHNPEHRREFPCSGLELWQGLFGCDGFGAWLDAIHARAVNR